MGCWASVVWPGARGGKPFRNPFFSLDKRFFYTNRSKKNRSEKTFFYTNRILVGGRTNRKKTVFFNIKKPFKKNRFLYKPNSGWWTNGPKKNRFFISKKPFKKKPFLYKNRILGGERTDRKKTVFAVRFEPKKNRFYEKKPFKKKTT